MGNTKLTIHFPKQEKDYNVASRSIRRSNVFKNFVTGKSKDRRTIYIDFETEAKFEVMEPILFNTINEMGYVVERPKSTE